MFETDLEHKLAQRFGEKIAVPGALAENETLAEMAGRGSCRWFRDQVPDAALIRALCAVALASPSKSDLQQRDIVMVQDPVLLAQIKELLGDQGWIAAAPSLLVFCANNRRQRLMHGWWGRAFANDHLDALFNASVDAGIALSAFVTAAEAAGLGCCPISTIRNQSEKVAQLLGLPDHVFAIVGLAVGYPEHPTPRISMRLPLSATVHTDRYDETGLRGEIETYDTRRASHHQPATQRQPDVFGQADPYTWSDDKTRQYSQPERADFGAFLRRRGFRMD